MKCFDFPLSSSLIRVSSAKNSAAPETVLVLAGHKASAPSLEKVLKEWLEPWQLKAYQSSPSEIQNFTVKKGQLIVVQPKKVDAKSKGPQSLLGRSLFAAWMETAGLVASKLGEEPGQVRCVGLNPEEIEAAFCGLEMGRYKYKDILSGKKPLSLTLEAGKDQLVNMQKGVRLGQAVNFSRHLINTPPNVLNPKTFAAQLTKVFQSPRVKAEVWDQVRLKKEGMNLHLAVGQGAPEGPRLVKISYRPARGAAKSKPLAFVGKGITFDSGGLNIKPDRAMRLMKKDMGGAASLAALAWWVMQESPQVPCDFYLALAENSVSKDSFRPSDILTARNGMTVEIDNTDAEGRLVLADALDVAASTKPRAVVDLATLTGAMKVGLGSDVPGFFSNQDEMARELMVHGFARGDVCWQMPLYRPMFQGLKSPVADMVNCTSGFGGAVTAALFLEKFVGEVPWAHFDLYAWQDKAGGAYAEAGGRGQMVLALSSWLSTMKA